MEVTPDKKLQAVSTSIRLSYVMVQKLRKVAKKKDGIGYQTLLKLWIAERLEKEISKERSSGSAHEKERKISRN